MSTYPGKFLKQNTVYNLILTRSFADLDANVHEFGNIPGIYFIKYNFYFDNAATPTEEMVNWVEILPKNFGYMSIN